MTHSQLVTDVLKAIPDAQAIYLSGSRLNHLNVRPTDYDVFVITKPTMKSILTGQHFVSGEIIKTGATYADAKIYDSLKLMEVYLKSNPNTAELFYRTPLFTTPAFAPIAEWLGSEPMLRYGLAVGHTRFVHAVFGQIKQEGKSFVTGKVPLTRQAKIVVTTSKFARYLEEYLTVGMLTSVETPTARELELREQSAVISELTDAHEHQLQETAFRKTLLTEFEHITARIKAIESKIESGEYIVPKAELNYDLFVRMTMLDNRVDNYYDENTALRVLASEAQHKYTGANFSDWLFDSVPDTTSVNKAVESLKFHAQTKDVDALHVYRGRLNSMING